MRDGGLNAQQPLRQNARGKRLAQVTAHWLDRSSGAIVDTQLKLPKRPMDRQPEASQTVVCIRNQVPQPVAVRQLRSSDVTIGVGNIQ